MDDDERAYRRAYYEAIRERLTAEREAAEALEAERELELESRADQDDYLYRYGLRLADPHGLERYRAKQLEIQRAREQYREQEEARAAEIRRQQQVQTMKSDANWSAWVDGKIHEAREAQPFTDVQRDVLAEWIGGHERKREREEREAAIQAAIDKLRAELTGTGKAHERGVLALPAPVVWKVKDNAA
jgi:hypothetical protein